MKSDIVSETHIYEVDVHSFEKRVIQQSHQTPVLVDLWAEWCSPCRVIAPVLKQLIEESEKGLVLAKLEVDAGDGENMKIAGHYRVRGFPTIILFVDGEEKGRFSGARSLSYIRQFVDEHVAF